MGTFRVKIEIARPADDVFAFVADPENMPLWYDAVERVDEITPATPTQGARYLVTRSLPGGPAVNMVAVTEAVPGRAVTLESRDGPTPFRYRYTVEPHGRASVLTLDADISSAGLPGPFGHLDGIATRAFKQGMGHNLDVLKRLLEAPARR